MKALIWLLGIAAALGVYLAGVSSPVIRGIGIIVFLIGAASIFFIFYYLKRYQKAVYLLQQQIMDFLEGRVKTPKFSVNDDLFALLENAVVELENRLLLERHQAVLAGKKNADFITDVSHQLKTPLAALKLYCEMDQSKNLGAHTQKQLVLIEHMERLVYSLLRLEKLRANVYGFNMPGMIYAFCAKKYGQNCSLCTRKNNLVLQAVSSCAVMLTG